MIHSAALYSRVVMGVVLLTVLFARNFASAAIAGGPVCTNEIASKQKLNSQFYEAQQSYAARLRVGRERYAKKQESRAGVIAGMRAELQTHKEIVVIDPAVVSSGDSDRAPFQIQQDILFGAITVFVLGVCFHLYRRSSQAGLRTSKATPRPPGVRFKVE